ncbi:uncharacterized protein MAM_03534 [Metarhizium album ARSEF 1941]|uniref:ER-bound oxygenase mpaB/mpaB'/Rubber oxygenase catalytic domain-containing protein n=1 Tax=Metarhizium album (strain ARSEF 1941) TaxID=1081103 RepID=A0A0B2X001_METAS|nr:uncharacterized protein MAM_03534 [Metarhizium album ARSEF 1941]KHN98410.1 hypothetical protein MAM_03534 [Metarhizium album ARSEF 1941]
MYFESKLRYKWIKQEIESLDPEVDYEKIWRLSASYNLNDFILNLAYALSIPSTILPEHSARPVWREGGGKMLNKATNRVAQTVQFLLILAWYGPKHSKSIQEVERVNRLHEYWSDKYPGDFSHPEDYIYAVCLFATQKHQLFVRVGLPGLSEKEKIAAHHFWKDIYTLLRIPGGKPLDEFPMSWDGMINSIHKIENLYSEGSENGRLGLEANYAQLVYRFFPFGFRWLGRRLILALAPPKILQAYDISPVHALTGWLIKLFVRLYFLFMINVLPDPKVGYWELLEKKPESDRRRQRLLRQELDRNFPTFFSRHVEQLGIQCPFVARPDSKM